MAFTTLKSGVGISEEWSPTTTPAATPTWASLTTKVRRGAQARGRPTELDRFAAGISSSLLDNRDRAFDPLYSAGANFGNVLPEKRYRRQAQYNSVTYDLFQGFIDAFPQLWDVSNRDATVELTVTDAFKVLQQAILPNSMYELVSKNVWTPDHWWKLNDSAGATSVIDSGATPVAGLPRNVTLGSTGVLLYDGGQTSAACDPTTSGDIIFPGVAWPQSTTAWSIVLWFNAVPQATLQPRVLLSIGGKNGLIQNCLEIIVNQVTIGDILIQYTTPSAFVGPFLSGPTVVESVPHMVAVTLTSDTKVRTYFDGALVDTSVALGDLAAFGSDGYSLGSDFQNTFPGTFATADGSFQHFQTADGVTLTAQNVLDLYNAGIAGSAGEDTGARVTRILDYIGWSSADRTIQTGSSILGAYDLPGGTALDYLNTLADTEQGMFYAGCDGKIVWRSRQDLITATRSATSQATFTDSGTLEYSGVTAVYDETKIFNDAKVTRQNGADQIYTDATSVSSFFKRTYTKTVLNSADQAAADHASWAVYRYKNPALRVEELVIKPAWNPTNWWPQVLGREIGDRITFVRTPQGVGSAISQDLIIEGIEHAIAPDDWTTTFKCSPVEATRYWILDDTTSSVLDSTTRLTF